jgi:opacity protein-like surface antigen
MVIMGSIYILNPYFLYSQTRQPDKIIYNSSAKLNLQVYAMYVSSAELQNNLGSSVSFLRDASIELKGGYGYGAELNYNPGINNFDVVFYLSSEYLKVKDDGLLLRFENDSATSSVRFTEEYNMLPLEAGLKWNLPVSTERFKIYIGGGGGVYFGNRTRTVGPYKSSAISRNAGFSMNVLAGIEYFVQRNLSLDFEFKFREATFDSKDKFDVDYITIGGNVYSMDNPLYSRILVDGTRISAGIKYHF